MRVYIIFSFLYGYEDTIIFMSVPHLVPVHCLEFAIRIVGVAQQVIFSHHPSPVNT